jgi:hypothetical protein
VFGGDDVLDVEGEYRVVVLMDATILAPVFGTVSN